MRLIDAEKLIALIPCEEFNAKMAIANAPTVDAEPVVHGEWRLYSPFTDTYECNNCGYQVIDESFRTNFCPNCGAKMIGDDEDV